MSAATCACFLAKADLGLKRGVRTCVACGCDVMVAVGKCSETMTEAMVRTGSAVEQV